MNRTSYRGIIKAVYSIGITGKYIGECDYRANCIPIAYIERIAYCSDVFDRVVTTLENGGKEVGKGRYRRG